MIKILEIFTIENIMFMVNGASISLLIATSCLILGTIIGMLISTMKISKNKSFRLLASVYVEIIRGTPMLLQLMFFYLVVPYLFLNVTGKGLDLSPVVLAIIAISINSGAYIAELFRSSILSIDKGQWEAGESLGLNRKQLLKNIILPQAIIRSIIPLANEYVTLIKDSSLGSVIGVVELLQVSKIIGTVNYNYVYPLLGAAVFYLAITLLISYATSLLERRYIVNA